MGVVNGFPVNNGVPPVAASYQLITRPGVSVTERVTVPAPQEKNGGLLAIGAMGNGTKITSADPVELPEQLLLDVETRV